MLREQERQRELQRLELTPPAPEEREQAPEAGPETGATILVEEIRFAGKAGLLTAAEREEIAGGAEGRQLGLAGLRALVDQVTFLLQQKGLLLARAVLPPQDITEGVVVIEIVEGRLEETEFQRSERVRIREDLLRAIGEGRIDAEQVRKADLEEALLRMNDLPGVAARARLQPGEAAGTSRLVVGVEQAPVVDVAAWGDNYGSTSTGRGQASGLVTLTDMTGFGDLTLLQGTLSEGLRYGRLDVSAPLWASGLTAQFGYGYLDYDNVDDTGKRLELRGRAHQVSAGLDYTLLRSRDVNLYLGGGVNWQALTDDSIAGRINDKRVIAGTLSLSGDARHALFRPGVTSWNLAWTLGDLDLSRLSAARAADAAGLRTQGTFHRLNAHVARLQDLPSDFSLFARLSGQWASKNLDSSQDFALGGPYGVRAYPVGEGRGDMGLLGTVELRYDPPIPLEWGHLQLAGFLDAGRVRVNKAPGGIPAVNRCGCNDYALYGAGLGLRWTRENLSLSASYARALGSNPGRSSIDNTNADGRRARQQVWLRGTIRF